MEVPASLYALRVPAPKVKPRRLNGVELALAGLVYSHAVIGQAVPYCAVPIETVAEMIGGGLARVRDASRTLARAGYWRRVQVGSCLWRWEIVILPSDPGHRWCDIRSRLPADPGQAGSELGRPDQGQAGSGLGRPDLATPGSGLGKPDQGYRGRPDPANQDQEQIRTGSSSCGQAGSGAPTDPRQALADAINAQTERAEAVRRANPPERMSPGSAITPEHRALLDRYDAVIASWPPGSPERDRAAACRPALPVPHVIESAIQAAGGLVRIIAVHEWAWRAYAAGRLTKIGSVDASQALVSAFLGAGRFWQSILAAYNQAHPRQQTLAEWQPTPDPEGPPIDPETYDNLLQAIGR